MAGLPFPYTCLFCDQLRADRWALALQGMEPALARRHELWSDSMQLLATVSRLHFRFASWEKSPISSATSLSSESSCTLAGWLSCKDWTDLCWLMVVYLLYLEHVPSVMQLENAGYFFRHIMAHAVWDSISCQVLSRWRLACLELLELLKVL